MKVIICEFDPSATQSICEHCAYKRCKYRDWSVATPCVRCNHFKEEPYGVQQVGE